MYSKINLIWLLMALLTLGCRERPASNAEDEYLPAQAYRVVGYVAGYRDFDFTKIQAEKLTHINYAFANVIDGKVMFDTANIDDTSLKDEDLTALQRLKDVNPNLKILVSVGGWTWSGNFSDAALTEESRAVFAKSAADFVAKYRLDGIDIDWEYPNQIGAGNIHREEDIENFTLLMKDVRAALDQLSSSENQKHFLLTIATGADSAYVSNTNLGEVAKYLDFINIMTYDFYNGLHHTTGHHANLYASSMYKLRISDVVHSVDLHEQAGVPLSKLTVGIPFYGRRWEGVAVSDKLGLYEKAETVGQIMFYRRIAKECLDNAKYVRHWDEAAKAPYLWNKTEKIFISYEDEESIKYKMNYLKEKGLSGVMFWEYSDDYQSKLLDAIHDNLNN